MRARAPMALLASLAACSMVPAVASADSLKPYLGPGHRRRGRHAGGAWLRHRRGRLRHLEVRRPDRRVRGDRQAGRLDSRRSASTPTACAIDKPVAKSAALGDSPNPFFNVYRMYSEPGGIADEMKALAAANPDVMKLEQIGTSTLGKPIYVIKMTQDARNVPDGTRPAALFSATNHAREWIAAEMGRRLPGWFAEHKNDPKIKRAHPRRVSCGSCRSRTRTATTTPSPAVEGWGAAAVPCDYRTATRPDATASGARRCATTTPTASTATARTAWTRTATTRPSAASTRRAPPTASPPAPTAARTRSRSRRTSRSTACSGACRSSPTSTGTRPASCC